MIPGFRLRKVEIDQSIIQKLAETENEMFTQYVPSTPN